MIIKILISGILIYLIWGLIYHKRGKSLTFPVYMEYLLISLLAVIMLMGVIF